MFNWLRNRIGAPDTPPHANAAPRQRWENFSVIRRIARNLCYRELDELIGVEVTVRQRDSLDTDITPVIQRVDPHTRRIGPEGDQWEGAASKYGLLDLTYAAPSLSLSATDVGGVSLIRHLSLVGSEPTEDDFVVSMAFDFLKDIAAEAEANQLCIRVFLRQIGFVALKPREPHFLKPVLSDNDFPLTFRITDACLTNAPQAWIAKHFYM